MSSLLVSPGGASADDPTTVVATTDVITEEQLNSASDDASTTQERAALESEFLADSAQEGVLYDSLQVESSIVGEMSAVWSDAVDVEKVFVTQADDPGAESSVVGLGVVEAEDPSADSLSLTSAGSDSLTSVSGQWGERDGGNVQVTVDGFKLISGWERWRVRESKSDREVYYYGHWATAKGKSLSGIDLAPYVVDVRSRPKSGRAGDFLQLRNYWPKVESPSCSGGAIGIDILGFGGSLPLQNCSSLRSIQGGCRRLVRGLR